MQHRGVKPADRRSRPLAARAGSWSASHWKRATFGWLAVAAAAMLVGTAVGAKTLEDSDIAPGETGKAERILADAGFRMPATESVLVQSRSGTQTARDPQFQSVIAQVVQFVSLEKNVTDVQNPLEKPQSQLSRDRRSALVQFGIKGDAEDAADKIQPILDEVASIQQANPSFRIEEFGAASATHVVDKTLEEDFSRAEMTSLPVTLVILLLAFGALVAAGLPVLLAFSAVLAAVGLNQIVSHVLPTADPTKSIILLIGMAVGVDYSLFYLRREREERAAGHEPHNALQRAAATSGQAVLISGGTVLVAMAGMLLAGNAIFTSIGVGTMIVVFGALMGSLTVLPALMHKLGDRVDRPRIPCSTGFGARAASRASGEPSCARCCGFRPPPRS